MSDVLEIAKAWASAWERSDSEAFVSLFTADVVYRDDQAGRVSNGKGELRAFHEHFAQALSDCQFRFVRVFQQGADACIEWTFTGVHSGVWHGRQPTGQTFASKGASLLTLAPDGKISACVDYYDAAAVAKQLQFA